MDKLIFIKLGGSIITDKTKPFVAKEDVILRLGKEIVEAQKVYKGRIIIGHGSGSFGHSVALKYKTNLGIVSKKSLIGAALVEDAAVKLNRIVIKNLLKLKLNVFSFSPASFIYADLTFTDSIEHALNIGLIPVIYGDVVFDKSSGFGIYSTEAIISRITQGLHGKFNIKRAIYCTDTDGVYDNQGKTIPVVNYKYFNSNKSTISKSGGLDVTGGMIDKVEESLIIAKNFGLKVEIINGNKKGNLKNTVLGATEGTRIKA